MGMREQRRYKSMRQRSLLVKNIEKKISCKNLNQECSDYNEINKYNFECVDDKSNSSISSMNNDNGRHENEPTHASTSSYTDEEKERRHENIIIERKKQEKGESMEKEIGQK